MRVFVILRVFDRLADLEVCLDLLRTRWTRHDYEVLVVSNGAPAGHRVPDALREGITVAELAENPGHRSGNALLLAEGVRRIPDHAEAVVLLEADTWLMDDALLDRYLRGIADGTFRWASAAWEDRYHSLAVDFAVVDAALLRERPDLLAFGDHPEADVARRMLEWGEPYRLLRELMPVHVPRMLRRFHPLDRGRFRAFPEGPMVTHHIEQLPDGLAEKKRIANRTAGEAVFPEVAAGEDLDRARKRLLRERRRARLVPRAGWVRRRRVRAAS